MRTLSSGTRFALVAALALGGAATAPLACFFPSYTYDLPNGGGATASSSSTSTGTMASTSSGSTGTASSSTSTSSGTGGTTTTTTTIVPCASADCSDPTCAASYKCVPTPSTLPTGWMGYFALYDGAPSGVPGCGGAWPTAGFEGNGQIMVPPATCPCTCGAPTGGTCAIPELDINDAACGQTGVCTGPVTAPSGYTAGTCFNFPYMGGYSYYGGSTCGPQSGTTCQSGTATCNVSADVGAATVSGSTCTPSSPNPQKPSVTWGATGQACGGATAGKGCTGTNETCMPIPENPFVSGVCIMQTGEQSCPPGQFTDQHIFYTGTPTDTRGCTACTCGAATGDSCTVSWSLYSDGASPPSCQSLKGTYTSGACAAVGFAASVQITSAKATVTVPPNGGTCAAVDGQATGTVTPTGPTTFCCIP